jgi:hypothetical protein
MGLKAGNERKREERKKENLRKYSIENSMLQLNGRKEKTFDGW